MLLTYEAIDEQGRTTTDSVEAHDAQQAVTQLRRQGLYVTHIAQRAEPKRPRAVIRAGDTPRLPLKTMVVFTRQMAMLLRAGSGLVPAIHAIRRQMKKEAHRELLGRIVADLEEGAPLSDALRQFPQTFDAVYCAIVAAGEASATLTEVFDRLAVMMNRRRLMRNKIIGTLSYPALLVGLSGSIVLTLLFFVIPRFNNMFTQLGVQPPASTLALLSVAEILRTYWMFLAATGLGLAIGGVYALISDRGKQWVANVQTAIPVVGRLRSRLIQAQVLRTMGTLVESGIGVLEALELVRGSTRNRRFQQLFDDVEEAVTSGGQVGRTFEQSGLMDAYVCQAVCTGEDSGNLGGAIVYAADMLDETNEELLLAIMKLVEPVILIGMGLVVGGVAVALFLPLFDLTAALH